MTNDNSSSSSNDSEPLDAMDWSDGQRGLDGGLASGQASFDAPADTGESEIESIDEVNEGGIMEDARDPVTEMETEQGSLVGSATDTAGAAAEGDGGLFDYEDEDADAQESGDDVDADEPYSAPNEDAPKNPTDVDDRGIAKAQVESKADDPAMLLAVFGAPNNVIKQYTTSKREGVKPLFADGSDILSYYRGAGDTFEKLDGVGEKTNKDLRRMIHPLEQKYGEPGSAQWRTTVSYGEEWDVSDDDGDVYDPVEDVDDSDEGAEDVDEWTEALAYLREQYGDDYQDRIEFSSDIAKLADAEGIPLSQHLGGEAVTQALLRFRAGPDDTYSQIESKIGENEANDVRTAIIAFADAGASRHDTGDDGSSEDGPEHPNVSKEAHVAKLVVGRQDYALPQPWDGWHDVAVVGQNVEQTRTRGDHVAYISEDRREALVFEGTVASNKWALSAWRYAEPMPEYPTAEDVVFGPDGLDGGDERVKLTHGNTPTVEGWAANTQHYLTVEEVRETVPEPVVDETDAIDERAAEYLGEMQDAKNEYRVEDVLDPVQEWTEAGVDPSEPEFSDEYEARMNREPPESFEDELDLAGADPEQLFGFDDDGEPDSREEVAEASPSTLAEGWEFGKAGLTTPGAADDGRRHLSASWKRQDAGRRPPSIHIVEYYGEEPGEERFRWEVRKSSYSEANGWTSTQLRAADTFEQAVQGAAMEADAWNRHFAEDVVEPNGRRIWDEDDWNDAEIGETVTLENSQGTMKVGEVVEGFGGEKAIDFGATTNHIPTKRQLESRKYRLPDRGPDPIDVAVSSSSEENENENDTEESSSSARPKSYVEFPDTVEVGSGTWEKAKDTPNEVVYERPMMGDAVEVIRAENSAVRDGWNVTGYTRTPGKDGVRNTRIVGSPETAEEMRDALLDDMGTSLDEIHAARLDEGDEDDENDEDDVDESELRGEKVEFGRLDAANDWRDANEGALHPNDTRRTKTVTLALSVAENVADDAEKAALESRGDEGKKYGQTPLTDAEKDTLAKRGFVWGNHGFQAQAVKAALEAEGSTEWMDHYEIGEGVGGALANFEAAKERQRETGASVGIENTDSDENVAEIARKVSAADEQEKKYAEEACEEGEGPACDHLRDEYGYTDKQIEQLREYAADLGEPDLFDTSGTIYDPVGPRAVEGGTPAIVPSSSDDPDRSAVDVAPDYSDVEFESFAAFADRVFGGDVAEPSTAEVAGIAPTPDDDPRTAERLPGNALRAIKKAWTGYKHARLDHHTAQDQAEKYAGVINGIRLANGYSAMSFDELDGWDGGAVVDDDPDEKYPTAEGEKTLAEAGVVKRVQSSLSNFASDVYDPISEQESE